MKTEAHYHGACQYFIREFGAPELNFTNNPRTETVNKWEDTSQSIITKNRKFATHNQNQSKSGRKL